jgi:hypothetical protein
MAIVRIALSYQPLPLNVTRRLGLPFVVLDVPIVREAAPLAATLFRHFYNSPSVQLRLPQTLCQYETLRAPAGRELGISLKVDAEKPTSALGKILTGNPVIFGSAKFTLAWSLSCDAA